MPMIPYSRGRRRHAPICRRLIPNFVSWFFTPRVAGVLAGMLWAASSQAQPLQDTLAEVNIQSRVETPPSDARMEFAVGQVRREIDTAVRRFYQTASLARLLEEQTTVFVKSYGVNSMATLSFRGASAAQSAVLWNGIPIANPALGVADISLLNQSLFDNISLQMGSSSALLGSGNVGGALLLENKPPDFSDERRLSAGLHGGSFGRRSASAGALWQNDRLRIKANAFYEAARNDFSYTDAGTVRQMPHARLEGAGATLSIDYRRRPTKEASLFSLQLWGQSYDRQIPPALFESGSQKRQRDRSLRSFFQWQKRRKHSYFYTRLSVNSDQLRYEDGAVLPDNQNDVLQIYGEAGWKWKPRNAYAASTWLRQEWLLSIPVQYAEIVGGNLREKKRRFLPALVVAYKVRTRNDRLQVNAAIRSSWDERGTNVWLPGAGMQYRLLDLGFSRSRFQVVLEGNLQKTYRLPNLNELYFSPGGNPRLKPEKGWNEDAGIRFDYRHYGAGGNEEQPRWQMESAVQYFNRQIEDWVYWLGGAIWTPHNLAAVHSRGIETQHQFNWRPSPAIALGLTLKTAYVLSTTTASYLPGDGSIGKQIPYTPRYKYQWGARFEWRQLAMNYGYSYTGYRFITVDESQYLDPYSFANLQISYSMALANQNFFLSAQVLNLWDDRYEVVNGRPVPGRHFLFGIAWNLNY